MCLKRYYFLPKQPDTNAYSLNVSSLMTLRLSPWSKFQGLLFELLDLHIHVCIYATICSTGSSWLSDPVFWKILKDIQFCILVPCSVNFIPDQSRYLNTLPELHTYDNIIIWFTYYFSKSLGRVSFLAGGAKHEGQKFCCFFSLFSVWKQKRAMTW